MTTATFPVSNFREAAVHLRKPFTPAAVKFKVQATWPKDDPKNGLVVAYIDARLAVERLNLIVPHLWSDDYEPLGKYLICRLTVDGITRQDIGEGEGKGLYSDALKRAAVKFGVGVSLYAIPKMIIGVQQGHAKPKRTPKGPSLEMTEAGENRMRTIYSMWLDEHGSKAFGEPLDHGDVLDAAGDHEATPAETPPSNTPSHATAEDVQMLKTAAKGLTAEQVKVAFGICKLPIPDPFVPATVFMRVPQHRSVELYTALGKVRGEKEAA